MVAMKVVIAISLVMGGLPSVLSRLLADENTKTGVQEAGPVHHYPNYDFWVGWTLGGCLVSDCSIFIGTLREVVGPVPQQPAFQQQSNRYYSRVRITVDEWLYGEPQQWNPVLRLNHVPFASGPVVHSESPEGRWRDVELSVRKRLLIVLKSYNEKNQQPLKEVNRYALVVSDGELFEAIRGTLANHMRYAKNPDEILDAPRLLDAQSNRIFSGYLLNFFRAKAGEDHSDTIAIVLSQLMGNIHFSEEAWHLFEAPLIDAMSNRNYPVSEVVRNQVTRSLVTLGCSDTAAMARSALKVLVILSDSNDVDIRPFLVNGRRARLVRNYRELISPGSVDKGQAAFESQLGPKSN